MSYWVLVEDVQPNIPVVHCFLLFDSIEEMRGKHSSILKLQQSGGSSGGVE